MINHNIAFDGYLHIMHVEEVLDEIAANTLQYIINTLHNQM